MHNGWRRLGIVISAMWLCTVIGYALYEWQAPFFKKEFFFSVVSHPELPLVDGAIFVTTPFLVERFIAIAALPLAVLWLALLVGPAIAWVRNGFKT